MRVIIYLHVFLWYFVKISQGLSCYNTKTKKAEPYKCRLDKCAKIKCKGNLGKDQCNCCDICLKQEGETCGGEADHLGKCDHHVPECVKNANKTYTCTSFKTLIKLGKKDYLKKVNNRCELSDEYIKMTKNDTAYFECIAKTVGPTYYCQTQTYSIKDCCIHNNSCHPNKELLEEIRTENTSYLAGIYRKSKKKRTQFNRSLLRSQIQRTKKRYAELIRKLKRALKKYS